MAKAGDETGAETTDTTRSKTRAVARTKTSEAKAKTNEGEVAETWKNDPLEITEEPLAKTTDTEAAETTGGNAGTKIGHVIRTENDEYNVAVQEIGTEQIESKTSATSSFLDTLQAIATEASDYSRWSLENRSTAIIKVQNFNP